MRALVRVPAAIRFLLVGDATASENTASRSTGNATSASDLTLICVLPMPVTNSPVVGSMSGSMRQSPRDGEHAGAGSSRRERVGIELSTGQLYGVQRRHDVQLPLWQVTDFMWTGITRAFRHASREPTRAVPKRCAWLIGTPFALLRRRSASVMRSCSSALLDD